MLLYHHLTPLRCHCRSDLGIMAVVLFGQFACLGVEVVLVFVVVVEAVELLRLRYLRMLLWLEVVV